MAGPSDGKSRRRGELISDLDTLFREAIANNGEHFEVPTGSHWNGRGQQVLTDANAMTDLFGQVLAGGPPNSLLAGRTPTSAVLTL